MIYFVQAGDKVKIGTAIDVRKRIRLLQTGNAYNLRVLGVMPGDIGHERVLHEGFADFRVRGEWFRLSDEICSYIETNCRPHLYDLRHTGWAERKWRLADYVPRVTTEGVIVGAIVTAMVAACFLMLRPLWYLRPSHLAEFNLIDFSVRYNAAEQAAVHARDPFVMAGVFLSIPSILTVVVWMYAEFFRELARSARGAIARARELFAKLSA